MNERLRLLLVTDAVGGVWTYSVELARALDPIGVETILAVVGPAPTAEQRRDAGVRLIETGLPLDWADTDVRALRRAGEQLASLAEREHADVVQTCSAALLADVDFARPTVAVQHSCVATWWAAVRQSPLPPEFQWRKQLVSEGLERATAVVAPTQAFAAQTRQVYGLDAPVFAIHNGRAPLPLRSLPQGAFVFTAGRLWDEGKGTATLDAAAARLSVPFQAAGAASGPNGATIDLNHLQLLGELSQSRLAGVLATRPVFASAALYEPFGLSVLEAAQAGCALVLSDIATHRELWDGAAQFISPGDSDGFAVACGELLSDPARRNDLASKAQDRAQRYTPQRMAASMASLYREATRRTPAQLVSAA